MAEQIAKNSRAAFTVLKTLSNDERNAALQAVHNALKSSKNEILKANVIDMNNAEAAKLSPSLIKRLDLSKGDKFDVMLQGVLDVAALEDPVGKLTMARQLDEGLDLYRVTAPVGVLLIIFESRPEVIANITALAIKSGNSAILKGGKESLNTFTAMASVVNEALSFTKVPKDAIQLIASREDVAALLDQDRYIDLVIPRGSNELVRNIKSNTKIPVLGHADGICSIYVDRDADLQMAAKVVLDAKTNYPAGCNAVEQLLIHESLKEKTAEIVKLLLDNKVTLHVTEQVAAQLPKSEYIVSAVKGDFDKEFLSFDIAVDYTRDVNSAISHINIHSSGHTESIITENKETAEKFLKAVDSSGVYWNASTRFADGFRYGFGTEVGISTNKIHARGPVGLEGLVIYQYQIRGHGQVVGDYLGGGGSREFIHKNIDIKDVVL
jgi:glutamate-5-semialdehyde dehydrogenase